MDFKESLKYDSDKDNNENLNYIMLKCIKDIEDSEYYDEKLYGYSCGEDQYTKNDIFMIDSKLGYRYVEYYPDCFEKIEMTKSDWISLAEKRIEWAKYALIGRNSENEYLNRCREEIQKAKTLITVGLENNTNLNELLFLINGMPDKQCLYWYDTPRDLSPDDIEKAINEKNNQKENNIEK